AAAAQRFKEQGASKGIAAAVDDVAPDRFVDKFVVKAPTRELAATKAELLKKSTGATSIDDLARRIGTPDLKFSGRAFGKALDAIEPEKLHLLFTPDEIGQLRTLQKAASYLTEEVPFSDVNHSKTAGALANLLMKVGGSVADAATNLPIAG